MPTVMTHAFVAAGLGALYARKPMPPLFWLATAGLAMLPDLDVLAFGLGIPYEAPWGHRGASHSLLFALAVAAPAALWVGLRTRQPFLDLWGYFFAVAASHGVLDGFTNGGHGVAYFWPFDDTRYFFPWRPVEVSQIGLNFFGPGGWRTLRSEIVWMWLPTAALLGPVLLWRWKR